MPRAPRWIIPTALALMAAGSGVAYLALNPTAREVTFDSLGLLFAFFSTPFIFETTCALAFLFALLAYNRWRLHKEGDGWVWLMHHDPAPANLPPTITQRLQSTILQQPPEDLDEPQARAGVIEGYLELGMAAQAQDELRREPPALATPAAEALRIRILAANLDTEPALDLLRRTAPTGPYHEALAAVALENARWLLKHLQREDLAQRWVAEALALDPAARERLRTDENLHHLA